MPAPINKGFVPAVPTITQESQRVNPGMLWPFTFRVYSFGLLILLLFCSIFLMVILFITGVAPVPFKNGQNFNAKSIYEIKAASGAYPYNFNLNKINDLSAEGHKIVGERFDKQWSEAKDDFEKFDAYHTVYNTLWANYNRTRNESILEEMNNLEDFIKTQWPEIYQIVADSGGFSR